MNRKIKTSLESFDQFITNEIEERDKHIEHLNETNVSLRTQLLFSLNKNADAEKYISNAQANNKKLSDMYLSLLTENEKLKKDRVAKIDTYMNLLDQFEKLKKAKLNPDITEIDFVKAKLKAMYASYTDQVKENQNLKDSIVKLKEENKNIVDNYNNLIQENKNLSISYKNLKESFFNVESENKTLAQHNKRLAEDYKNLDSEYQKLKEVNQKLTIFLKELGYDYSVKPKANNKTKKNTPKPTIDQIKQDLNGKYKVIEMDNSSSMDSISNLVNFLKDNLPNDGSFTYQIKNDNE